LKRPDYNNNNKDLYLLFEVEGLPKVRGVDTQRMVPNPQNCWGVAAKWLYSMDSVDG